MQEVLNDLLTLIKQKKFRIPIILMAIFSYGMLVIYPAIGVDDTAIGMYFEEGLATVAGRWVLYLINKVFRLADYNPYFVELLGVLIFCVSTCLWCVLFKRIFKNKISDWVIVISACVFISSPILSEILVWYLQNGIYMAYGLTAIAIMLFLNLIDATGNIKQKLKLFLGTTAFLTLAVGCYESFMFVYVMTIMLCFAVRRVLNGKQMKDLRRWLLYGVAVCVVCWIMRSVVVSAMVWVFRLQGMEGILRTRSVTEVFAWFTGENKFADLIFIWKQFFVLYYVNAAVYLPITLLVLAIAVIGCIAIYQSLKKKDIWILLAVVATFLVPWFLPVLEGVVTPYRTAQYIPVICAFAVLMAGYASREIIAKRWVKFLGISIAVIILYHQGYELNKWFYVDYLKYEDAVRYTDEIALELERNYDTDKPILIVGSHNVPYEIVEEGYVPYWSKKYIVAGKIIEWLDPALLELYNTEYGYAYVQTPFLSVIEWGTTAFHHTDVQLIEFMNMHGHDLTADQTYGHYIEANELITDMPSWPKEGSIVDRGDHILVNLGKE